AASAIAICDRHPFVERVFGDAVLYIDPRDPARSIDQHLSWVNENQSAALQMAERAHSIFLNLSLERLLDEAAIAHTARLNSIRQQSEEGWV
ncbi:hypothetical protein, partial [Mesorhizobium sp. GbtcB19]|uniref:hypothetical protein n=1 Tax=Mesorhizobium sp. GbtcB19 TaxID=2824764 RepID=UPI001C3049F3